MKPFFIYNYNMELKDKKLYLLDMDGTIYLGDKLFEGAAEFLSHIKEIGAKYIFLTNNSSKGKEDYIAKMKKLGIEAEPEDFLTSVDASVLLLRKKYGQDWNRKKIYVLGTESFRRQMKEEGFLVYETASQGRESAATMTETASRECEARGKTAETASQERGAEILLVGYDTELTYKKLEDACSLLEGGADYFATNPDWVCPAEHGSLPDCGSICQMLEHATGRRPYFIGKPRPDMALIAMEKTGFSKEETLLVGDRLYTDIACGNNAGIDTCFVLSGEGTLGDIEKSESKPTYILDDIRELLRRIRDEA